VILVINLDTGDLIAPTFYETLSQNNKVMVSSTQPCQETDNLKFISDSDPYQAFCRMLSKVKPEEFKEPIIILLIGHGMIVNGHHNIVIEYPTKYQFLHTKDIFRIIDQSSIIYELVMISCHSGSAHADFDNPRATL
jgi:hypothetical protein